MGLGVGIFLAAVGAVLAFAVTDNVNGVNIHTIGWILLIVGILGIVLSMVFWSSWAGPGYFYGRRRAYSDYADDEVVPAGGVRRRRRVIDEDVV
jgi:predicted anti-sigma-YlaC factor YlaD